MATMQQQQMYQDQYDQEYQDQQGYEFAAQPQPMQQKGKYRDPQEYGDEDGMYESDDGYNQEENYWEELEEEQDDETQLIPDYYIDRPPTPQFKPLEKGKDISTQIEDHELFDFEIEVIPVLQVLVGKTIDQSRMELIEDSEKVELQAHKDKYVKKRNAELLVTQRMENAFLRRKEERERRDQQHHLRGEQNKVAHQKLICRNFAKRALYNMKNTSLNDLEDIGFLKANIDQNIKKNFVPWLLSLTSDIYNNSTQNKSLLNNNFQEYQTQSKSEHQKHIQAEIERKENVLKERERKRLLLEERRKKKKEWKRKQALKNQREQIYENLEKNVALQFQKVENILEAEIADILGDGKATPVMGVFGGLIGQLWLVIGVIQKLNQEEELQLTAENIHDFIMNLLTQKLKTSIVLNFSDKQKELIQEKVTFMENDLAEFNNQKEQIIQDILDNPEVYSSFPTLNQIKNGNTIPLHILKSIMKSLLDIYFKSLNFKKPEAQGQPEGGDQSHLNEDQSGENKEQPKPDQNASQVSESNFSPLDLQMMEAKKKLSVNFFSEEQFETLKSHLRLRIPFLSEEEIQKEKEEQEEEERKRLEAEGQQAEQQQEGVEQNQENADQEQQPQDQQQENVQEEEKYEEKELTEEEIEAQKWAKYDEYVEIYNGDGYDKQIQEKLKASRRRDVSQELPMQFNIGPHSTGIQDERSEQYLRMQLLQLLKEQFPDKLANIEEQAFQEQCTEQDSQIQQQFAQSLPNAENIAIFDYDIYQ